MGSKIIEWIMDGSAYDIAGRYFPRVSIEFDIPERQYLSDIIGHLDGLPTGIPSVWFKLQPIRMPSTLKREPVFGVADGPARFAVDRAIGIYCLTEPNGEGVCRFVCC